MSDASHIRRRWVEPLLFVAAVVVFFACSGLFVLAITGGHYDSEQSNKVRCANNLKQIGLALHNYLSAEGSFPPACVTDEHGHRLHSWRVLLLPYFEIADTAALYREYDLAEPWDGPNNRRLIDRMPDVYRCPADESSTIGLTNYVAVVGDEAAWPNNGALAPQTITDGLANTVLVVETRAEIPWTKPHDLAFDRLDFRVNSPSEYGLFSEHRRGPLVLFADGSVHDIPPERTPEDIRALMTRAGGEDVVPQ